MRRGPLSPTAFQLKRQRYPALEDRPGPRTVAAEMTRVAFEALVLLRIKSTDGSDGANRCSGSPISFLSASVWDVRVRRSPSLWTHCPTPCDDSSKASRRLAWSLWG